MSALKHGLFRVGFMLCDRCSINTTCERFQAASPCMLEKQAFEHLVDELTKKYELDMVADRILAERAAMYLIRISRAESYEATVGFNEKSVFWAIHISRLDNTLRGLLNDLAVSRAKRKGLEKTEELMVNIEDLLQHLAKRTIETAARTPTARNFVGKSRRCAHITRQEHRLQFSQISSIYLELLNGWKTEKHRLQKRLALKRN